MNLPANKERLTQSVNEKDELGPSKQRTQESLCEFLSQVYAWRLEYVSTHKANISMEPSLTASRVLRWACFVCVRAVFPCDLFACALLP